MSHFHHILKGEGDDQVEICLEYIISSLTPATHWDPAEGGEAEIIQAWIEPSGEKYEPTDDEYEKWRVEIEENHDHSDSGDDGL